MLPELPVSCNMTLLLGVRLIAITLIRVWQDPGTSRDCLCNYCSTRTVSTRLRDVLTVCSIDRWRIDEYVRSRDTVVMVDTKLAPHYI